MSEHYVISPFQPEYDNIGFENLKKIGLDRYLKFENGFSHNVLPTLLKEGKRFDFAFIDGSHLFDFAFIDFYYIDLLLNHNGYVLLHDKWMRSIQFLCGWINTNKPYYELIPVPAVNLALYQKRGTDSRNWDHFNGFYVSYIVERLINGFYVSSIIEGIKNKFPAIYKICCRGDK